MATTEELLAEIEPAKIEAVRRLQARDASRKAAQSPRAAK
jgi:hypothetical protein